MNDKPITKQQLDALEIAVDKLFARIGIDVEFTRHFIDRLNDERNRKQITLKELGQLFAKEYQRWGKEISTMPISAQAVMKDLSSAINLPMVIDKSGKQKQLVAKTILRKPNFKTTSRELPVENVQLEKKMNWHKKNKKPMSEKLTKQLSEAGLLKESDPKSFIKNMRQQGWDIYASRMNGKHLIEFTVDGNDAYIIGDGGEWELYRDGSTITGRGEMFDSLEAAFQSAISVTEKDDPCWDDYKQIGMKKKNGKSVPNCVPVEEDIDDAPLDVKTLRPQEIAKKHDVPIKIIIQQLNKGIDVEMEHTSNHDTATEIALDHLGEDPDYYKKLADIDSGHSFEEVKNAWQNYKLDEKPSLPANTTLLKMSSEARLLKTALDELDNMVQKNNGRQSLVGLAFDIAQLFNLSSIATVRELAELYREWKGDTVVTEGWMEKNFYYIDEVIETKPKKKCRPKAK